MMLLKTGGGVDLQRPLIAALRRGDITAVQLRELEARAKADARVFTLTGLLKFYADELAKRTKGLNLRDRKRKLARKLAKR